jgi:hypothetical protein
MWYSGTLEASRTMEVEWCGICKRNYNPETPHTCVWDIQDIEIARHDLEKWLKTYDIYVEVTPE